MGGLRVRVAGIGAACLLAGGIVAMAQSAQSSSQPAAQAARIKALEQRIAELEKRTPPELGQQMLLLELRHDRLWWAGEAGNWNLAYYMAGEMNEAIQGIVETNGDVTEVQPQKLSAVVPTPCSRRR